MGHLFYMMTRMLPDAAQVRLRVRRGVPSPSFFERLKRKLLPVTPARKRKEDS